MAPGRLAAHKVDAVEHNKASDGQGVGLVSPITPCCSGDDAASAIIAFYDPDGTIVELASFPFFSKIFTVMSWFDE